MNSAPFSAVLLAAGRSTRMGRDKALLDCAGRPLWQRQRDVLAALGAAEMFLSARPDQEWARSATGFQGLLYDELANAGPLCGVTAALERAEHGHVVVLAVDLPRMTAAWLGGLLARCAPGAGAVGRRGEFYEPLAAVYPREMKWAAWEALAAGRLALQPLVAEAVKAGLLHEQIVTAAEEPLFENWNDPRP
jgi:molybdopterin-guanine dinucleotide biosynthesis protein A